MTQTIAYITLLVRDYEEALAYFTRVLGFEIIEDTVLANSERWVLIAPRNSQDTRLLLERAVGPEQVSQSAIKWEDVSFFSCTLMTSGAITAS